jgi:hypothetical protein
LETRVDTLQPEICTVNQILRAAANDPDGIPVEPLPIPTPVGPSLSFATPIQGACP